MQGDIAVVPDGDAWIVQQQGGKNGYPPTVRLGVYEDQDDAEDWGRQYAEERKVEFFLMGEDGRIRERDSYGNDPPPPESPDAGWTGPKPEDPSIPDRKDPVPPEELPPPVPPTPDPDVVEEPVPSSDETDSSEEVKE